MLRRLLVSVLVALIVVVVTAFAVLPGIVDRRMNRVAAVPHLAVSDSARRLHQTLTVADLHADQLLWSRDPLQRASHGHVDLPRMDEGNVALQVFSVVTKTPRAMNYDANTGETDNIRLLALVQRWPMASAHGVTHGGLTPLGREVITRVEALHVLVDLAHVAPQVMGGNVMRLLANGLPAT